MNVTIKDVARVANVSVATVSRALNGHENVAESVRVRVLAAAKELRYTPHHAARSLSSRKTNTIGVVLPMVYGEFFSELMRGIDQAGRDHGLHLLVSSYHCDPHAQGEAVHALRGRVDGVLLMTPYTDVGHPAERLDPGVPAVLINSPLSNTEVPMLSVENRSAAREMVAHLLAGGRRRIAFIAGPENNFDAGDRLLGYREALAASGADAQAWVVQGDFNEASGHQAALELLAADPRPDAVFAANDMMALGCLFAFQQAGVDVPGEIAVAGFDDIPLARYANPPLTTMRVDIAGLGARAMQMLLDRLGTGVSGSLDVGVSAEPRGTQTMTTQLVVRESTVSRASA